MRLTGPLVMVRDRSFRGECHRAAEDLPDSVMPVGVVGREATAVRQLDDRSRFGLVCPKIEQAGHSPEAPGVLAAAELPVRVAHRPQPVAGQPSRTDLGDRQDLAEH